MNRIGIRKSPVIWALAVAFAGCGGYLHTHSSDFQPPEPCTECPPLSGTISSPVLGTSALADTLYKTDDALVRMDQGVEIDAPYLELNTGTGEFVLTSMRGRIARHHVLVEVLVELARGTSLNVSSKGPARGDDHGYIMTGGASLSLGDDAIRAHTIEVHYF